MILYRNSRCILLAIYLIRNVYFSPLVQAQQQHHELNQEKRPIECGIYLAPSSIPHAGLGMFVGNYSFQVHEIVTTQDIVIPIIDREYHTGHISDTWLFDEYIWNADVYPGMEQESHSIDNICAESAGVGSAANSYLSLANVEDNWIELSRGPSIELHSPGMGSSTVYHGRSFFATAPLRPGQEIFVDYGSSYFSSRKRIYGYLPIPPHDYTSADKILRTAMQLTRYNTKLPNPSVANEQGEIAFPRDLIWQDMHKLLVDIAHSFDDTSRVLNAIPTNVTRIEQILNDGGTAYQDFNRSIMDLQWLEQHGQCMDNIKVEEESTIQHAGRGAFATRYIPKGGLVAPAPLIHVANHDLMKMFSDNVWSDEDQEYRPDVDGSFTYQLIYNYCFVHEDSKVALFPYGMYTNLINHASPPHQPNTRINWSQKMRHPEWLNMSVEEWGDEHHTGLQIDFIALRDIEEGEEILIDYGSEWQRAWDLHVQNFVSPYSPDYMPSYELNKYPEGLDLRIYGIDPEYELDHVDMFCRWWYLEKQGLKKPRGGEDPPCRVLKKLGDNSYLAEILIVESESDDTTTIIPEQIVWGLPKQAFYWEDLVQTRDMHQPVAFRHAMKIPNDIFPDSWKSQ